MIIIEGPDCAGKTTLAEAAFSDMPYYHQGPYKGNPFLETLNVVSRRPKGGVWDRLHLGEQVYGPIYRNGDTLGPARRRMLERYLLSRQALVILALPPLGVVLDEFEQRKNQDEMFGKRDEWRDEIKLQYDAFARIETHLPVVRWDYTRDNIVTFLDNCARERPQYNDGPGVGDAEPGHTLIVGERPGTGGGDQWKDFRFPFIGPYGCSKWLAEVMDEADVSERKLYWVNSFDQDNRKLDATWLKETLKPSRVIALGGHAKIWCQMKGFDEIIEFEHPAYHSRFKSKEPYPLIEELTHVC